MPVRSSNSSVFTWPDRAAVSAALAAWFAEQAPAHPSLRAFGYYGSYARGDCGVGSDLDLVAVVEHSDLPFERRAIAWPTERLPVPADLSVYTVEEWRRLLNRRNRFIETVEREVVWLMIGDGFQP